jgi:hypothetical protein
MNLLKDIYPWDIGWDRHLYRMADGVQVPLKVPAIAHSAQKSDERVAVGSEGLEGKSPFRWITIMRFDNQKISFINTHFIADAYNGDCGPPCVSRWNTHWDNLKTQVTNERQAGYNIVLTGDFNRRVNDHWSPANVNGNARLVKAGNVDFIIAIPNSGWKVEKVHNQDGSPQQGEWPIGIDHHEAHWVKLKFSVQ